MTILEALKKGITVTTRDGRLVRFICLLQTPVPAPLVVGIYHKFPAGLGFETYRMENYYSNGRYNSLLPSDMDLIINYGKNLI